MEHPSHVERMTELRQDAWQRASRSIARHEAKHEWMVKERKRLAVIERKRAAEARRVAAIEAQRQQDTAASHKSAPAPTTVSLSGIAACIAKYESGGNPRAENPTSSASGLYQFTDGTWGGYGGYSRASQAPVSVQTERFYQVWNGGRGAGNWVVAPRCGY
jgi:hypothetical protein